MDKRREEIINRTEEINTVIDNLKEERQALTYENLLISDEDQWFTEKEETFGRGKRAKTYLIGRIHWVENFQDNDTGDTIQIERSRIVREDGQWVI